MSKEIQQNNQEYGADQIQILEVLRRSEKDRVCISAVRLREDFIIWFTR